MARLKIQTVSLPASGGANSSTNWIPLNQHTTPFNVGFGVITAYASGHAPGSFTVQHTFDDVLGGASASVFDHSDVSGVTTATNIDGNYAYPVNAVRLTLNSAGSGVSTASLYLIQAGD